jgi:membrane protein DedA with SNARE-associated domain
MRTNLLRLLGLLLVIGISAVIYVYRDQIEGLPSLLGYPGIFIAVLLSNATILFPAPGGLLVYSMGGAVRLFNPIAIGLAAGTGGAIGEMSGYIAGLSGRAVIERMDVYERIAPYIQKYGGWAIFVVAAIPNPFFDLAGVAAGALKMPAWRFFLAAWGGNIIKMLLIAYAGAFSLGWFLK